MQEYITANKIEGNSKVKRRNQWNGKYIVEKISKAKSRVFEKIDEIDKPLAWLDKKKRKCK